MVGELNRFSAGLGNGEVAALPFLEKKLFIISESSGMLMVAQIRNVKQNLL